MTKQEAFDAIADELLAGNLIGRNQASKTAWYSDIPLGQAIEKATNRVRYDPEGLRQALKDVAWQNGLVFRGWTEPDGWRVIDDLG